jgi:formylglycine-generating enzyme required for sulfatase activity
VVHGRSHWLKGLLAALKGGAHSRSDESPGEQEKTDPTQGARWFWGLKAWITPGRIVGTTLFLSGLVLGVWLGLWLGQPAVNPLQQQLQLLAQKNAELSTALDALNRLAANPSQASQDSSSVPDPGMPEATRHKGDKSTPGGIFLDALNSGEFGPEMVRLPRGLFLMGSDSRQSDDNEKPVHEVTIAYDIALARHEVTFDDYDRFADATGRARPDDNGWGRGRQPVVNVSWRDATAYARWLASETQQPYRLPTEAEWEYAARAGTRGPYWWGDELGSGFAVCDECGSEWDGRQPAPAGSLDANPWGLHDLNGNVDEWVQDCYIGNHEDAPIDGSAREQGNCEYRVMRGGSWFDIGRLVRASSRYRNPPNSVRTSWGFRVAVDLPTDAQPQ